MLNHGIQTKVEIKVKIPSSCDAALKNPIPNSLSPNTGTNQADLCSGNALYLYSVGYRFESMLGQWIS
jgi:hypothetical protein